VKVWLHHSYPRPRWVVSFTPRPLYSSVERVRGTHWIGGWVCILCGGEKNVDPAANRTPDRLSQRIPSLYQLSYADRGNVAVFIITLGAVHSSSSSGTDVRAKVVPVLRRCRGSGCIDKHLLNLGTSWRRVVSFTPRLLYPQGKIPGAHWTVGCVDPRAGLDAGTRTATLGRPAP
jgi:hypothetical protein